MLTRYGTRFALAFKLLLTTLSVAFSATLANAFSLSSSAAPLTTAAIGMHPPSHVPLSQSPAPAAVTYSAPATAHPALPVVTTPAETHSAPVVTTPAETHSATPTPTVTRTHHAAPKVTVTPTHTAINSVKPIAVAPSAGVLTAAEVGQLWLDAGGPAWAESHAVSISYCESGFRTNAYNPSGATGLWQILGAVVPGDLTDPLVNAENAVAKFKGAGDSFAPWVCQ